MASVEFDKSLMSRDEARSLAMSIATGSSLFLVLKAAIELDVLEIINRAGPGIHLSPAHIAAQLPTKNPEATTTMLDRMLRLLASNSILTCSLLTLPDGRVERLYGPAPVCEFFTKSEGSCALLLLGHDKVYADAWYHLKDAMLDGGIAFEKAHGMHLFEYLGTDTRFNKVFNNAMSTYSTIIVDKMLENYKGFEGLSTLVDVGGNTGATLNTVISKYPNIKGINYDLPHVILNAPPHHGIEHVAGDMFVSIPRGDAIFMKWILHDWSDEICLKILKNCYSALPGDGKVIVCDYILPMGPESNQAAKVAFNFDAKMMVSLIGGKERTEQEFEALAKGAGFYGFRVDCSAYDLKIMEFLKNK